VENFSLDRLRTLEYSEIDARYKSFKEMTHFEAL
jgi:hypothetical protein